MITVEKKYVNFNDVKFVLKAKGTDKSRPIFSKVEMDYDDVRKCKVLICTDGRRLHILYDEIGFFTDCENGQYDIVKSDAKEIVLNLSAEQNQFPNWKQIIPKEGGYRADFNVNVSTTSRIFKYFYNSCPNSSLGVNIDFLEDAYSYSYDRVTVQFSDPEQWNPSDKYMQPMVLEYLYLKAIIMPIQIVS